MGRTGVYLPLSPVIPIVAGDSTGVYLRYFPDGPLGKRRTHMGETMWNLKPSVNGVKGERIEARWWSFKLGALTFGMRRKNISRNGDLGPSWWEIPTILQKCWISRISTHDYICIRKSNSTTSTFARSFWRMWIATDILVLLKCGAGHLCCRCSGRGFWIPTKVAKINGLKMIQLTYSPCGMTNRRWIYIIDCLQMRYQMVSLQMAISIMMLQW